MLDYDVLYNDVYYRNSIQVRKNVYRDIIVGEQFPAKQLTHKLQYHQNRGLRKYIDILLIPQTRNPQNIQNEQIRIDSLYGYRDYPHLKTE